MKGKSCIGIGMLSLTLLLTSSCQRNGNDVWEDAKTAGRHVNRGFRTLCGNTTDSRQVYGRGEFEGFDDESCQVADTLNTYGYQDYSQGGEEEFIRLGSDNPEELALADMVAPPPRETPGEAGSSVPGIEAFRDPVFIPALAPIFQTLYFDYDSSLIRSDNLRTIQMIADYMRQHPEIYVFIEGHTDERGPEAYNLALGSRRSNSVRNALIMDGVNPDRLFTISYGKERPVILEHHEGGWAKNRRAEFKIYER